MLPLSLALMNFIQHKTDNFPFKQTGIKKKSQSFFCKRSQVKCFLLCIHVTKWRRQHGPQYLNGSWCVGCDGYDLTWWAINMSDMTQMSSERVWQSSIHTRSPTLGALPKTHCGALHWNSISGLIKSVIDIVPYLYQLCLLYSLFLWPQLHRIGFLGFFYFW